MPVNPSSLPVRKGSMPYSAGNTAVKRITSATARAMSVAFTIFPAGCVSTRGKLSSLIMISTCRLRCDKISGDLVADEDEPDHHQSRVGREGVAVKSTLRAPVAQRDYHGRQRQHLPDFHADIEADDVRYQSIPGEVELLKFGRQAKAVEQAENQDRNFSVGFKPEQAPEAIHVVEGLVDHGQADDGVDDIRIRVDTSQHAGEEGKAVADGEQADVQ